MVQGKARERLPIGKRIKDMDDEVTKFYGLIRQKISTPKSISQPFRGEGAASGDPAQGFLRTEGDSMIGPIAFFPAVGTISAGVLDIGQGTDAYSTRVIVNGEGAANDDLDTITNAVFAGQLLDIQPIAGQTITVKHLTGNIRLATGADIAVAGQDNLLLVFDSISNQWTNLAPDASATGGAGVGANTALSNLAATAVNASLIPGVTNTIDLGEDTTPLRWRKSYFHEFDIFDFGSFVERVGDPPTVANKVQLYAKDDGGGTSNLYFQNDAGTVFDLSAATSGANTALSNLVNPTLINQDLQPDTDSIRDLGDFSFYWDNLFVRRVSFRDDKGIVNSETGIGSDSSSLWLNQTILANDIGLYWDGTKAVSFDRAAGQVTFIDPINELRIEGGSARELSIISPGLTGDVLFTLLGGAASQGFKFTQFVEFGLAGGIVINPGGDADFNTNNIVDINNITTSSNGDLLGFRDVQGDAFRYVNDPTVIFLDPTAAGWAYNAGAGDTHVFNIAGLPQVQIASGSLSTINGVAMIVNDSLAISHLTDAYIDMSDVVVPPNPIAGNTRIFHDSADGILKVKKSGGSVVSLEAGGGGQNQTPWLSNINAAGFELLDVSDIELRDDGSFGGGRITFDAAGDSDTWIGNDNVTDQVRFVANAVVQARYNAGGFIFDNTVNLTTNFMSITGISPASVPTPSIGVRNLFVDNTTGTPIGQLSVKKSDGIVVSLEGGGAGGDLWSDPVDANIIPDFDNNRDLGSASKEFRDLYIDGTANIDFISGVDAFFSGGMTVSNTLTSNGIFVANNDVILGNSPVDDIEVNGEFVSDLIPDAGPVQYDIGGASNSETWGNVYTTSIWVGSGAGATAAFGQDFPGGGGLGFYGKAPVTKPICFRASGATTHIQLVAIYNSLVDALRDAGAGVGLVTAIQV